MTDQKPLPQVLKLRAERVLAQPVLQAFYFDKIIARCVLQDQSIRYVDLDKAVEVPAAQIKIDVENWGEIDTEKLTGKKAENYEAVITRNDVLIPEETQIVEETPKTKKKGVSKSTSTKKKK